MSSEYDDYVKAKNSGAIIVITRDLVREMRAMGKRAEAQQLIETQQLMVRNAKKEALASIVSQDNRKVKFQRKKNRLCTRCEKPMGDDTHIRCLDCRIKIRHHWHKSKNNTTPKIKLTEEERKEKRKIYAREYHLRKKNVK